jgi:DNA-binding MltR family transcriptional regulator
MCQEPVPDFDSALEFRTTLNPETDRGCALMAAAYLDERLGEFMKGYFVDDSKVADDLLEQSRPLGTFSSRIDMAYALGLISEEEHRGLHPIRRIRNDFGHVAQPIYC